MEADYGVARYIESRLLDKYLLICQSPVNPDCFYLFQRQSSKRKEDGSCTVYYRCVRCLKISSYCPSAVIVKNERVVRDPSVGHYPDCIPYTGFEIEVLKVKRQMRRRVVNDGIRPLDAYKEAMDELMKDLGDGDQFERLRQEIGEYKANRSSLYRCASKHCEITGIPYRRGRFGADAVPGKRLPRKPRGRTQTQLRPDDGQDIGDVSTAGPSNSYVENGHQLMQSTRRTLGSSAGRPMPTLHHRPTSSAEDETMIAVQNMDEPYDEPEPSRQSFPSTTPGHITARSSQSLPRNVSRYAVRHVANGAPQGLISGTPRLMHAVPAIPGPPPASAGNIPVSQNGSPGIPAKSVIAALTKALETCQKRSRWEAFGDYVGKTLESLPESSARKVSRAIQELLVSEQDALWGNGNGL